jgi:hypothetical protein
MFLIKNTSVSTFVLILAACNLFARCNELERHKSVTFVGIVLVCASATNEDLLKTEIANWLLVNGDEGFISQIIASSDHEEALFSGVGFRRPFEDETGFDRYIAAHSDSGAQHLLYTKPLLRRLRIGQHVQLSFREGPEARLDALVFRSSWAIRPEGAQKTSNQELDDLLWFAFHPQLNLLYVFALSRGIPTCQKCKAVTDLLYRLGLPADTSISVRTRRMGWFDDERFPRVFKFFRPGYNRTPAKSSRGLFIPSISAYYLDPEVNCETITRTRTGTCALFGRWSAENACNGAK